MEAEVKVWQFFCGPVRYETQANKEPQHVMMEDAGLHLPKEAMPTSVCGWKLDIKDGTIFVRCDRLDAVQVRTVSELAIPANSDGKLIV